MEGLNIKLSGKKAYITPGCIVRTTRPVMTRGGLIFANQELEVVGYTTDFIRLRLLVRYGGGTQEVNTNALEYVRRY